MGWSELENGDLLNAAEASNFAVMVTGDKNLSYQQNMRGRVLALVVLSTNDWNILRQNSRPVLVAVEAAVPGSFQLVKFPVTAPN